MKSLNEEHVYTVLKNVYKNEKQIRDNNFGLNGTNAFYCGPEINSFPFEEMKTIYQWLIDKGYLINSKIKIIENKIEISINSHDNKNDSSMTEKGIELYRKLSKKYNKEYFAEKARKKISENNNQNN